MTLQQRVDSDLKEAMRAKDATKLNVLRMLKSALKYAAIAKSDAEAELSDAEAVQVIRKQAKQRQDSIESFEKGGRAELADKEKEELAILNTYLPQGMSPDELAKVVRETIAELGATSKAQMGAVMKALQAKAGGRADGKTLSSEVQKQLIVSENALAERSFRANAEWLHYCIAPRVSTHVAQDVARWAFLFRIMMLSAIIVAGGSSQRMGFDKLFAVIAGEPVIAHAIRAFERATSISEIVVVAREQWHDEIRKIVSGAGFKKIRAIVPGGERRQDSVRAGLGRIDRDAKYVAVHDAARPLITPEQIERAFEQCRVHGAAALAQPVNDTLKRADADLLVVSSVDRHQLYAMQTPQIFERKLIEDAYHDVYAENASVTDEVSAVERLGHKIALVLNDDFNFKITYPRDLPVADFILRERAKDRR